MNDENGKNHADKNSAQQHHGQANPDIDHQENLIHLSAKTPLTSTPELNARLGEIERELLHLNAREAATNKAFRELLSDSRRHAADQTNELRQTHEQMSGIQEKYKKITRDYQRIAASTNILSVTLEQARSELTTEFESLKIATRERIDELTEGQLKMVERANRIEHKATQLAEDLDARVNVMRATISSVEDRLGEQLREIATQSEQRDEALTIRADRMEEEFSEQTGRLEITTHRLSAATEDLQMQSNILDTLSTELEKRSDDLETLTQKHTFRLDRADETIDRHHKGFAIAVVLITVTLGILAVTQQNRWRENTVIEQAIQENLATQENTLTAQSALQQDNASRIQALENQNQATEQVLLSSDEAITESIDQQQQQINNIEQDLSSLKEKAEDTASRMNAMSPTRVFGIDNTIHSAAWLAEQNPQHYVVRVLTAGNKQDIYSSAYRWSSLLNRSQLAYIEEDKAGKTVYSLIYGPFADQAQAVQVSRYIPVADFNNRPVALKLTELLK